MALCNSGAMSLGGSTVGRSVNCELGCSGTAQIAMNDAAVRGLAGVASGEIAMDDFYGASSGPETLGESFTGGFYLGDISYGGTTYYLIVAPVSTGTTNSVWSTNFTSVGSTDLNDGCANTYTYLNSATYPAGNFARTRTIGGCSDWYLPSRNEYLTFYTNRACLTGGDVFATTAHWSSTECNKDFACVVHFDPTVTRCFGEIKNQTRCSRAARRIPQ